MPTHLGINYFSSIITYNCQTCVQTKTDGYDEVLELLSAQEDDVNEVEGVAVGGFAHQQNRDSFALVENLADSVDELRNQMNTLTQKMNNGDNSGKQIVCTSLSIDR